VTSRSVRRGAVGAAALMVLAGCAPGASPTEPSFESRVDVDTPTLREAKKEARIAPCVSGRPVEGTELPGLVLPCLGGGPEVDLASVEGPAVISMWAQWCAPCRKELPYFQRLDESGQVTVLGLDWKETTPAGALALLDETGATFPQVVDLDGKISDHYRVVGLPGMLLVDGDGQVTFRPGSVRSYDQLASLVEDHTGARLTGG